MTQPYTETLEEIIRVLVRFNDSADGAVGDVRAALGAEAGETLRGILEQPRDA